MVDLTHYWIGSVVIVWGRPVSSYCVAGWRDWQKIPVEAEPSSMKKTLHNSLIPF